MRYKINCIYNYYDTLLTQWIELNDTILTGAFSDGADNLTEASGTANSNMRSRAKECFRLGLLTHELTKGMDALNTVKEDVNIQSRFGFITALIYKAYKNHPDFEKFIKAIAAINAIFSIIQPFEIRNTQISVNTIVYRLLEQFPQPNDFDRREWLRYILSAFCCELKVADNGEEIEKFILGQNKNLTLRIIDNDNNKERCILKNVDDVKKAIENKVSLTNIHHQKLPLFLVGTDKDIVPRGFYGLADLYFGNFLKESYIIESKDVKNSPFKSLYVDNEGSSCKKGEVLETIKSISSKNIEFANKYQDIMKSIEDGAIEALMYMTDKPKSAFSKTWLPANNRQKDSSVINCTTALRTKPFMLLAGISGTGKSRLVRELAFKSCPECLQDKDGTTPGNYCMIEVKPNWHDSTELLGYYSRLGKGGYQWTKFVKFLVKAKMYPDVPFFVCLDEMNLAPVEQYFAEILSILETRKHPKVGETVDMEVIKTGAIVDAHYFRMIKADEEDFVSHTGEPEEKHVTDKDIYLKLYEIEKEECIDEEVGRRCDLTTEGLTLPDNVLIIGTVNMDDTTHQFSRKVIDRAMTIEMNGGKLTEMYGGSKDLEYLDGEEQEKWQSAFKQRYVTADEVLEKYHQYAETLTEKLPQRLESINEALKGTPFEVSYRVLNELTIMVGVMLDAKVGAEVSEEELDSIINQAVDNILLMKILPRIEGDREMFAIKDETDKRKILDETKLDRLLKVAPEIVFADEEKEKRRQTSRDKIKEMIDRLDSQEFTRFWP